MLLKPRVIVLDLLIKYVPLTLYVNFFIFFLLLVFLSPKEALVYSLLSFVLILSLILTISILQMKRTTYEITDREIIVKRSFISEFKRTVPYTRITNVTLHRTPIHLLYGVGDILIDTAGTIGIEIVLKNIQKPEEILQIIEEKIREAHSG